VSDLGPGIPEDKLKEIFEPFFTSKAEGMGMGLSIARTIVEAHNGQIWAENRITAARRFGSGFQYPTAALDRHNGSSARLYQNHKNAAPPAKIASQISESRKYRVGRIIGSALPPVPSNRAALSLP
jgi:hypothetical protein